ncbi:YihY/virulence factor BrkB family protein [Caulobacter sp. 602-2]|uniref:YihY/virulence factor BrkB family protein n=1 Tax=Caulobacter sp. 602-2 TaxID=2710887 RepID=A0A6G4QW44_9CAUL|nr:YihY/virulence factor BrkB family protein [Caulobacter sp. 602-2]NGM49866.1 YihY/virulence factor BrkB family protein [Caulobacter sp. 602-2]
MTDTTPRRPVRSWLASRPYHLAPWILLLAVAPFAFPKRLEPQVEPHAPPPGLSEDRTMPPHEFDQAEPRRGRAARHPQGIPLLGWRDILWRTAREISVDKLPSVAGGVTFYTLLALFPAIGAFVSLYGLFADVAAVEKQLQEMATVFPASVVQIVGEQMLRLAGQEGGKLGLAFVVSLLLSIWSANASMKALFDGLNVAYDEDEKRNFVGKTLLTYGFTLCALLYAVFIAAVLIAAPIVLERVGLGAISAFWIPLRWLSVWLVTALAFAMLYRFAPCRARPRWRWVVLGALFGAAAWLVGSLGFSIYVNRIAHYDATYGPLGAVIAFMVWVWFSIMTVLVGAELNAEIEHQTAHDSTTGPEKPMGARGAAMADTVGLAFHPWEMIKREAGTVKRIGGRYWGHAATRIGRKGPPKR